MTKLPELPGTIAENIRHFTGRGWLLPHLVEWFEHSDRRLFILTGQPGAGKSMVMAWLAGAGPEPAGPEAQSQLQRIRSWAQAAHFCVAASGSVSPRAFARNMADQLTGNVSGFSRALADTLADKVQIAAEVRADTVETGASLTGVYIEHLDLGGLDEEASFDRALRQPLIKLYESGYDRPMLLLVDALDEALTYTGSTDLVRLLARLADLPQSVRFLVTARPDPRVLKYYPQVTSLDLIESAPSGEDDVRLYACERLAALPAAQRSSLSGRISQAAAGNFLYAHLLIEDLLPRLPHIPDLESLSLPGGLSGLYHDFFNRELGADEDRWYRDFRPVLGLIAVGQGDGLSRRQLERITGHDVEPLLRVCRQYLEGRLPDGPFGLFHKSLADFLLEDNTNLDCHVDASAMHGQIADYYLCAWGKLETGLPGLANPSWRDLDDGYGLRALAAHLEQAGRGADLHRLLALQAGSGRNGWYEAREAAGDVAGYLDDVNRAWRLATQPPTSQDQATSGQNVALQCRYALIHSTIVSLSQDFAPRGVSRSDYRRGTLIVDPLRRIETLARLMPSLNPEEQAKAKAIALSVATDTTAEIGLQAAAIEQFAPFFSPAELEQACEHARRLPYEVFRGPLLCQLLGLMPDTAYRRAVMPELVEEFKRVPTPSRCSVRRAPSLTTWPAHPYVRYEWGSFLIEALPWVRLLSDGERQAIFENVLPQLEGTAAEMDALLGKSSEQFPALVDMAARLSPYLPEDLKKTLQETALQSLGACRDDDGIANGLLTLAPGLDPGLFPLVRSITDRIHSRWVQAEALLYFSEQLDAPETARLERILDNPWHLAERAFRIMQEETSNLFLQVAGFIWLLPRTVAFWFAAQRKGGFRWERAAQDSKGTADQKAWSAPPSSAIEDKSERNLTLVSLQSRLKSVPGAERQERLAGRVAFGERSHLHLVWLCQQAVVSRYTYPESYRSDFVPQFVLTILGELARMPIAGSWHSWSSALPHDVAIVGRLRALDIPGFSDRLKSYARSEMFGQLTESLLALSSDKLNDILPDLMGILRDLSRDDSRLQVLLALLRMDTVRWPDAFRRMVDGVTAVESDDGRAIALSRLVPHLLALDDSCVAESLDLCLRALARRIRASLLVDLRFLAPLVERLGGTRAIREVAAAIVEITQWWP